MAADAFAQAIAARKKDGTPVLADSVIRLAVVRLILEAAQATRLVLTAPLQELVARVLGELGVDANKMPEGPALLARVHGAMPVELQTIFEQAMREAVAAGASPSDAAAALLSATNGLKGFVERVPPPKGAVAAGPMARFLVQKKDA
jgi:hypothetical protein